MNSIRFSGADRAALSTPLVLSQTGKRGVAAIVLLPVIAGVNDYVMRAAHRLAADGFAVAILDYFAREGGAPDVSTQATIDVAVNSLADRRVISDACGLVGHEAIDPKRVGSLGFCIGGMYWLMLSAETSDLSASVDYYGSVRYAKTSSQKPVSPLNRVKDVQAPFLAHFGTFDRLISTADIDALDAELARLQVIRNFSPIAARPTPSMGTFGPRPIARSQLAWQRTMTFPDWHLKGSPARFFIKPKRRKLMNKLTTTIAVDPGANMKNTDTTDWSKFMTDDEYYPFLVKKNIRPAIWRWRDLKPRLDEVAQDPLRRADRRFIALVNADTGEAGGVLPSIFLGIQIINPGEHIVPHRHNSYALYHIITGSGYSIVGDHKFEWSRGDTFGCSPWASHEHINTGTEPAIQYVIQDMPARAMDRNLIWEEPIGHMFHMVEGNVPHSD